MFLIFSSFGHFSDKYLLLEGRKPYFLRLKNFEAEKEFAKISSEISKSKGKDSILLLDGIDEMPFDVRRNFTTEITKLIKDNPELKVIITGRYSGFEDRKIKEAFENADFEEIRLKPLTDEQILEYGKRRFDLDDFNESAGEYTESLNRLR